MDTIKKVPLLTKSAVISLTGSPIPYVASFIVLIFHSGLPFEQQALIVSGLYIILNLGRVFILEYIYERWPKYTPLALIKRLLKK